MHRGGDAFKKIIPHFLLWEVFCYCSYQHLAMIKLQKYLSMAFGGIGAPQKRKEKKRKTLFIQGYCANLHLLITASLECRVENSHSI